MGTDSQDGNTAILFDTVINTFFPGLDESFTPFNLGSPCAAIPSAPSDGTAHEPIAANVIAVWNDVVMFDGGRFLRNTYEPSSAVGL